MKWLLIPAVLAVFVIVWPGYERLTKSSHLPDYVMSAFHEGEYISLSSAPSAAGPVPVAPTCYRVTDATGPTATVHRCTPWDRAYYELRGWWREGMWKPAAPHRR